MRDGAKGRVAKMLIAAAAAATLGGCFHVPARAWANGRELGYAQESMIIYGQHNPTMTRRLNSEIRSSAMGWQSTQLPFSPFQQWDWVW
jgi:hypothetical protein